MSSILTKKVDLSFTGKTIVILALTITIFILLYYIQNDRKSASTINYLVSSLIKSRQFAFNQCRLSMIESDNWFCESNIDWIRRKILHYLQYKFNHNSNQRPSFFQNNWEPIVHCEFERRVGNVGDGGKWVCDIDRFEKTIMQVYLFTH